MARNGMIRERLRASSLDPSTPLFALLVLLMLLPAGFVLWFMNEAITTQAAAARTSVLEAYRGQLRLVRSRVDTHWRAHAISLNGPDNPERRFADLVTNQIVDGAVLLNPHGSVAYPDRRAQHSPAAAALDAQIGSL